jgi:hypothetical protein
MSLGQKIKKNFIYRGLSPPNVFIGGPVWNSLDSRLKHGGMTGFGQNNLLNGASCGNPARLKYRSRNEAKQNR